jgi:hypothetical protein
MDGLANTAGVRTEIKLNQRPWIVPALANVGPGRDPCDRPLKVIPQNKKSTKTLVY